MASTSAESPNTHDAIDQYNKQKTWLVPTKFKLQWKIEDVSSFTKIISPKMSGPADTNFMVYLRMESVGRYFVEMQSFSPRAPLKIKGEISTNNADYLPINRLINKGSENIKLLNDLVQVQESNSLEVCLEFISFPVSNQFLKVNKNAAQFGGNLDSFLLKSNGNSESTRMWDCYLQTRTREFFCHKSVLGARSPKFDSLFTNSFSSNIIYDCDDSVFQGLLEYLYAANPYKLIEDYPINVVKQIVNLGETFGVSEISNLFEKREFLVITKKHSCSTNFETAMTSKEFSVIPLEKGGYHQLPKFSFCQTEWNIEFKKHQKTSTENEKFTLVLNKVGKKNVTNLEVCIYYMNLQKEWVELPEIKERMITEIKSNKKRKIGEKEDCNKFGSKNTCFKFAIEENLLQELFCSNVENFNKLILKCEIKHKNLVDNIDSTVKTLDAFRSLYDRLHFDSLFLDFKKLYESKKYVDMILSVTSSGLRPKEIEVHKIILAARSRDFLQKIHESNDNKIEVKVSKSIFKHINLIVRFLYTNEIDFTVLLPVKVYKFAFKNSIMNLMNLARDYLKHHHLSESSADNAMQAAIRCGDELFKDYIKSYMSKLHSKIWKQESDGKNGHFESRRNI